MGVYIKGMEMPRNCGECRLRWRSVITDMDTCKALLKDIWKADLFTERLEDCPLVPVPPHGRMIDADALEKKIEKNLKERKIDRYDRDLLLHYLDVEAAPTIIEAEEDET